MSYKRIKNIGSLETYKQIYDHLLVPPNFVVPKTAPWPTTHQAEFNLGQYVCHIRQQRKKNINYYEPQDVAQLDELGFIWNVTERKSQLVLLAAETYYKIHGNLNMKHRFVVPDKDEQWHPSTWKLKLQSTLQNIKHVHIHETIHEDLQRMGLVLEQHDALHASSVSAEMVTNVSNSVDGASDVASEVEPVRQIDVNTVSSGGETEEMEGGGGDGDKGKILTKKTSKPPVTVIKSIDHIAELKIYKHLHGDLLVPVKYVIPRGDENWPVEFQGFALGSFVFKLRVAMKKSRRSYNPAEIRTLNELDFVWNLSDNKTTSIMLALKTYKALNHNLNIMYKFVVPSGDYSWPKSTWGIKLGTVLNNIKYNASYAHQHDELVELGIDFNVGQNMGPSSLISGDNPNTLAYYKRRGVQGLQVPEMQHGGSHLSSSQPYAFNNIIAIQQQMHEQQQQKHQQLHQQQHLHAQSDLNSDSEDEDDSSGGRSNNNNIVLHHSHAGAMMGGVGGVGSMLPLIGHASMHSYNDQQYMASSSSMSTTGGGMALDSLSQAMYRPMGPPLSSSSSSSHGLLQQQVDVSETHHHQQQQQQVYYNPLDIFATGLVGGLQRKRKVGDV